MGQNPIFEQNFSKFCSKMGFWAILTISFTFPYYPLLTPILGQKVKKKGPKTRCARPLRPKFPGFSRDFWGVRDLSAKCSKSTAFFGPGFWGFFGQKIGFFTDFC